MIPAADDLKKLEAYRDRARQGGGRQQIDAQHAKGKLTARERIDRFLDQGSFQELDPYLTHRATDFDMAGRRVPGDAVVTGTGTVDGRLVCVYAQDFTVFGGSFSEAQALKVARVMELALQSGHPIIGLNDSVGARIQEGVRSLSGYADLFWRNTQASGVVPQISLMLGPCAGGSVYSPGLTDFIVMVRGLSHMFITGPDVIRTVTGEEVDFETLGGAMAHASISGVAHLVADDETEALTLCRRLLSYLPTSNRQAPPVAPSNPDLEPDGNTLDALLSTANFSPLEARCLLGHLFDRDTFFELHRHFAPTIVVGFARLSGHTVGVVAWQSAETDGRLGIDASDKVARLVRLCDAFNIPLITLIDAPGFAADKDQARRGLVRHAARLAFAYAEATVPRIAVVTHRLSGSLYAALGCPGRTADLTFAWPWARLGDRPALEAAEAGLINQIIRPGETRGRLVGALAVLRSKQTPSPPRKHGNMPL